MIATAVGTATFTFSDAEQRQRSPTSSTALTQTKIITRQVFATRCRPARSGRAPTCARRPTTRTCGGTPAGSESGWGINFTHQGDTIFATWFTYDLDGTPLWLSASAAKKTGAGRLRRHAIPDDRSGVQRSAVQSRQCAPHVGTAGLTFADGNRGTFAYTVNGIAQTKAITRQVFRTPGTTCP